MARLKRSVLQAHVQSVLEAHQRLLAQAERLGAHGLVAGLRHQGAVDALQEVLRRFQDSGRAPVVRKTTTPARPYKRKRASRPPGRLPAKGRVAQLKRECLQCGAKPGEMCLSKVTGKPMHSLRHKSR